MRSFVDKLEKLSEDPELQKSEAGMMSNHRRSCFIRAFNITHTDPSTASSWLGWASSITSAASYNKTNPTAGAAATSSKEELKPIIKSDSDKEKQSGGVVENTSDQEEQEDDDRWEDGGWGEEVGY